MAADSIGSCAVPLTMERERLARHRGRMIGPGSLRLESVNVARAKTFEVATAVAGETRKFRSAILKAPVAGPVMLRTLGLEGDQQSDRRYHGGPEKAVLLYDAAAYPFWREALKSEPLPPGTFGENLTLGGFATTLEQELHVGDTLRLGDTATIQLTTPRQPCWKLETRMGLPGFAKSYLESGRLGMYARVVEEGEVAAGAAVSVISRSPGAQPISDLIRALYFKDAAARKRVIGDDALEEGLRRRLRADRG